MLQWAALSLSTCSLFHHFLSCLIGFDMLAFVYRNLPQDLKTDCIMHKTVPLHNPGFPPESMSTNKSGFDLNVNIFGGSGIIHNLYDEFIRELL